MVTIFSAARNAATSGPLGKLNDRLMKLYEEMSQHTKHRCGSKAKCRVSTQNRCCDEFYCRVAKEWAKEKWNVDLEPTGHPELPFMGKDGCVVPPHMRPICTVHDCQINSYGFDPQQPNWTKIYFRIRGEIEHLELRKERSDGMVDEMVSEQEGSPASDANPAGEAPQVDTRTEQGTG